MVAYSRKSPSARCAPPACVTSISIAAITDAAITSRPMPTAGPMMSGSPISNRSSPVRAAAKRPRRSGRTSRTPLRVLVGAVRLDRQANSFCSLFDKLGAAAHKLVVGVYKDANVRDITFFVEMVAVCSNLEFEFVRSR